MDSSEGAGTPLSPGGAGPKIGAWSKRGEFLGGVRPLNGGAGRRAGGDAHLSVSRGSGERGISFALHAFSGGYRVLVEEWGRGGKDGATWLAPVTEEEESYIGLFSEEEVREAFPYLFAALEAPTVVEIDPRPHR